MSHEPNSLLVSSPARPANQSILRSGSHNEEDGSKCRLRAMVLIHSLITYHLSLSYVLFGGSKDGWSVVGDANRKAAIVSEVGESFDAGEIKA
jgi:hypothetical protein